MSKYDHLPVQELDQALKTALKNLQNIFTKAGTEFYKELEEVIQVASKYDLQDTYVYGLCLQTSTYVYHQFFPKAETNFKLLLKIYDSTTIASIKAQIMNFMGSMKWNLGLYDEALHFFEQSLQLSIELSNPRTEIMVRKNIALVYYKKANLLEAYIKIMEAEKLSSQIEDNTIKSSLYSWVGIIHREMGFYEQGFVYMLQANEYCLKNNNKIEYAVNLNAIGLVHFEIKNYDIALQHFRESIAIAEELSYNMVLADAWNNIGIVYNSQKNTEEALKSYEKSWEYRQTVVFDDKAFYTLNNIFDTYLVLNYDQKAEEFLLKVKDLAKKLNTPKINLLCLISIARFYQKQNNHRKSLAAAKKGLMLALELHDSNNLQVIYKIHADYFESKKNYKRCLVFTEMIAALTEENFDEEIKSKLTKTHLQNEVSKLKTSYEKKIEKENKAAALAMTITANHEMNQPLMVIRGNLDLLLNSLPWEDFSDIQQDNIRTMNSCLSNITSTLDLFKQETSNMSG